MKRGLKSGDRNVEVKDDLDSVSPGHFQIHDASLSYLTEELRGSRIPL